jgi:hypothetical protein
MFAPKKNPKCTQNVGQQQVWVISRSVGSLWRACHIGQSSAGKSWDERALHSGLDTGLATLGCKSA